MMENNTTNTTNNSKKRKKNKGKRDSTHPSSPPPPPQPQVPPSSQNTMMALAPPSTTTTDHHYYHYHRHEHLSNNQTLSSSSSSSSRSGCSHDQDEEEEGNQKESADCNFYSYDNNNNSEEQCHHFRSHSHLLHSHHQQINDIRNQNTTNEATNQVASIIRPLPPQSHLRRSPVAPAHTGTPPNRNHSFGSTNSGKVLPALSPARIISPLRTPLREEEILNTPTHHLQSFQMKFSQYNHGAHSSSSASSSSSSSATSTTVQHQAQPPKKQHFTLHIQDFATRTSFSASLSGGPSDPSDLVSGGGGQKTEWKRGGKRIALSKEDIMRHRHLPQPDAAVQLGVSLSTLKRRFYELGFTGRWNPKAKIVLPKPVSKESIGYILNDVSVGEKVISPVDMNSLLTAFLTSYQQQRQQSAESDKRSISEQ